MLDFPGKPDLVGKALPDLPEHSGTFAVEWRDPRWLSVSARVRAESATFDDDENTLSLPAFAQVDVSVSHELRRHVTLFVSVSNLFDATVVTDHTKSLERIGEPRTVWGGLRVRY